MTTRIRIVKIRNVASVAAGLCDFAACEDDCNSLVLTDYQDVREQPSGGWRAQLE